LTLFMSAAPSALAETRERTTKFGAGRPIYQKRSRLWPLVDGKIARANQNETIILVVGGFRHWARISHPAVSCQGRF